MYSPLVSSVTHFCIHTSRKTKRVFYQGGVGQVQWYVCMYVIRIYDVIFSSGPFQNTVWSKERTLLNIQNIEHTLRPMYSPLVSSVTHFCNNDTYEQKNKTWGGGSSTMVRMYVCNKDIRCNLFFRALPQHQSGARKTDYKTLQNCLELRL